MHLFWSYQHKIATSGRFSWNSAHSHTQTSSKRLRFSRKSPLRAISSDCCSCRAVSSCSVEQAHYARHVICGNSNVRRSILWRFNLYLTVAALKTSYCVWVCRSHLSEANLKNVEHEVYSVHSELMLIFLVQAIHSDKRKKYVQSPNSACVPIIIGENVH